MICPKYNAGYRKGILPWFTKSPKERLARAHNQRLVEVFSTFDMADVVFLRSLLDAAGIDHYFKDESALYFVKPRVGQVKLMVKECDADLTRELLIKIKSKNIQ